MEMARQRIFERDPDQGGVPPGFEAYILRAPGDRWTGHAVSVKVENNLPHITYRGDASCHPTKTNEESRIFVLKDAPIDPAVFDLMVEF